MDRTIDILDSCAATAERVFPMANNTRDAALYLAHTGAGESIRKLAEASGTHPSTVLRAVRRIEQSRDDPIFDRLLSEAEEDVPSAESANTNARPAVTERYAAMDEDDVRREAKRFLRRLSEPGAFLLIAQGTDKAGIFCAANEHKRPIALLAVNVAAEFLKRDWIRASSRGTATVRYRVTDVGRAFLRRTLAEEQSGRGAAEAASPFLSQHQEMGEKLFADPTTGKPEVREVNLGESPIGWLTRRKGPDGKPFLSMEEVDAAERLRSDFEAAQLGPQIAQDWRKFLAPSDRGTRASGGTGNGAMMARDRVMKALGSLGPGRIHKLRA